METDAKATANTPTVYTFGPDFSLRPEPIRTGQSVVFSEKDSLPLFVVADGPDRSGVVLAVLPRGPWQFRVSSGKDGRLRTDFHIAGGTTELVVKPGKSLTLPPMAFAAYRGSWTVGFTRLDRLLRCSPHADFARLRKELLKRFAVLPLCPRTKHLNWISGP